MIDKCLLPGIILMIFVYALFVNKNSYYSFMEGIKDGLMLFLQVYPTLLTMNFSLQLLKSSHVLEYISNIFSILFTFIPKEIIPMVLFRPFSGSATLSMLIEIFKTCGVDSLQGMMASIVQGCTDTTLYVISLYFAHIGVKNIKNSLSIGLIADLAGMSMAVILTLIFFS